MNILIPHTWLLDHLETDASPQEIQRLLSLSGPSVERIYEREGESVYDIEVTTNRVDMMSVRGIAREAAVILQQAGVAASLKPLESVVSLSVAKVSASVTTQLPLPRIENSPELCHRIMCVALANVQHAATPDWMAQRLRQIDQQEHHAAIDITNYITHELGHPCHAFDYDKIMQLGGTIRVVEAQAGKKFTTLDGVESTTLGGEVVFENETGEIIDLPGIKGTANTAVDDSTKNILLWIESVTAKKIRYASMSHAIRTVAAQLNEKNVDPNLAPETLAYGIQLYQQLTSAQPGSEVHDEFPAPTTPASVPVPLSTISTYLGLELPSKTIIQILTQLGCETELRESKNTQSTKDDTVLIVTPPSFRPDITIPADVVEEIARIYGYHNLPSTLMDTAIPTNRPAGTDFHLEHRLKRFLAALGWQEVYTYSMVSEELALQSGYRLNQHLKLQNPLTDDRIYLRRSLVPSLIEVIEQNPNVQELSVFETAHTYEPREGELPDQQHQLTMVSTKSYRQVRGDLEVMLRQWYLEDLRVSEVQPHETQPSGALTQQAELHIGETLLGTLGVTTNQLTVITLSLPVLVKIARKHPRYEPIPKTSPVIENLTFTLPEGTKIGEVLQTIRQTSNLVETVEFTDQYQHNATFSITFWDKTENLSSERVEPLRSAIVVAVTTTHGAKLVGTLSHTTDTYTTLE